MTTIPAVLVATIAAAVASVYTAEPWDILSTVLAALGATILLLLIAVRVETNRGP